MPVLSHTVPCRVESSRYTKIFRLSRAHQFGPCQSDTDLARSSPELCRAMWPLDLPARFTSLPMIYNINIFFLIRTTKILLLDRYFLFVYKLILYKIVPSNIWIVFQDQKNIVIKLLQGRFSITDAQHNFKPQYFIFCCRRESNFFTC